jgi:hypothetical protein
MERYIGMDVQAGFSPGPIKRETGKSHWEAGKIGGIPRGVAEAIEALRSNGGEHTYQAPVCQEAHVSRAPGLIGSRER